MSNSLLVALSISMAVITTLGVNAQQETNATAVKTPARTGRGFRPVIEFGHEGGNLRPYRIGVDANGRVKVLKGSPQLKVRRISVEKLRELVSVASDKNFWEKSSADDAEEQKVLPDFGFVFVRLRQTSGSPRTIYHQGQQAGPLGRFYTQLADLVLVEP
jgi:hypothetical protein